MSTFTGTKQDFKRYVGPRLCVLVRNITLKHRQAVAACEHCGSADNLESAHVRGRERTQIIDLLLAENSLDGVATVDLAQFERNFKAEHEPVEKAILILCQDCHRKYDVGIRRGAPGRNASISAGASSSETIAGVDILPITLDPSLPDEFKEHLLASRSAEIAVHYSDGRVELHPWDASRFSRSSNVMGNLRSRPEFRQGRWQAQGIVKVHVRVLNGASRGADARDASRSGAADSSKTGTAGRPASARVTLPIILDPPSPDEFKEQLLTFRRAEIAVHYSNGRVERHPWTASKLTPSSNVMGNLRSRSEFRQGRWEESGIVAVYVTVDRDAATRGSE